MSEAAPVPIVAPLGRPVVGGVRRHQLNPIEALERGFALFRSTFADEAWRYYVGAAPLVIFSIPLWVIDGQVRVSDGALLLEALLLSGVYVLRVVMVAKYAQRVRQSTFGVPEPKISGAFAQAAAIGRLLAWKITLSAATLATLTSFAAAPWFYTACQFASLEAGEDTTERHSLRGCLSLAGQWYGRSVLLFLMLFPLWAAIWMNAFIVALVIPRLLHSIFGVNTLLSTMMGSYALLRSAAFWLSLLAAAWVALDPIVKCTLVVVYQALRSQREGDDLRGIIAGLPREQKKKAEMIASSGSGKSRIAGALVMLVSAVFVGGSTLAAQGASVPPGARGDETVVEPAREARVEKLRQALGYESQRAIYRWHDAEHTSTPTWFDKLLSKIDRGASRAWNTFRNFVRKLWPRGLQVSTEEQRHRGWQLKDLRLWLALIAVFTVGVGALLIWLRRRREAAEPFIGATPAPLPDLSNAAAASERSEDEWFALAERLEREGELRLALRAAYLGLLAGLAQREWLTIRRDRTNREYLDEFTRRWRRRPQAAAELRLEVPEKLRSSLRLFDRVWYGLHGLTPAAVAGYRRAQRELLSYV